MMINMNYSEIISKAKSQGVSQVDFSNRGKAAPVNSSNQDTLTLSDQALSLSKGENKIVQEVPPIYVRPQTAAELLAENKSSHASTQTSNSPQEAQGIAKNSRFEDMMQAILDKRLGVDRKKLEELEALKEEIAKNENLSPEEKAKAIEEIEKIREKMIEESMDIRKVAKQNDPTNKENGSSKFS